MNTVYNVETPRIIEMTNKFHNNYIGLSNFINNKFTFDSGGCIYYVSFKDYTLIVDNCFFHANQVQMVIFLCFKVIQKQIKCT